MSEFIQYLEKIGDGAIFLTTSPDVLDFTRSVPVTVNIETKEFKIALPLPIGDRDLRDWCGLICHYLSGKRVIIGWNPKNLHSYILGKLGNSFTLDSVVYDLQFLEAYIGLEIPKPENFNEAQTRLGEVVKNFSWNELKNVYPRIYNPLISKIIPEIETVGIVHQKQRKKLHAYYDISGSSGRMKCKKGYEFGFNPHSIMPEEREFIRPPFFDHVFMDLDFKNMEVAVLQWLSQDKLLSEIINSDVDVYEGIWTCMTGMICTDSQRQKCKDIFLPVMYGMGVDTLSAKQEISTTAARYLYDAVNSKFHTSVSWVKRQQELAVNGRAIDVFGRVKYFTDSFYKIRGFSVQSPAALFCLDKLVTLKSDLGDLAKIVFHIHDGYMLSVHRTDVVKVRDMAIKSLEKKSELFDGLKLRVSCKNGINLKSLV